MKEEIEMATKVQDIKPQDKQEVQSPAEQTTPGPVSISLKMKTP
jgi:hypothetical protein